MASKTKKTTSDFVARMKAARDTKSGKKAVKTSKKTSVQSFKPRIEGLRPGRMTVKEARPIKRTAHTFNAKKYEATRKRVFNLPASV